MGVWLSSLASVVAVSLVSLAGVTTLSLGEARVRALTRPLVAFGVGALLGDAFIHLIPETFRRGESLGSSLLVLGGMLAFFVLEKLLRRRHGHPGGEGGSVRLELAAVNLVGDGVHNFIDGVLIGGSYLVSPTLGLATTAAVLLHEIPQELADFGVLMHSGLSVRQAVLLNLGSASAAVLGTVLVLVLGASVGARLPPVLVPFAAGGFVYLATADLIPELQKDHSVRGLFEQSGLISLGVAVMGLLTLVG